MTRTVAQVTPGEQHITDKQAADLMALVNTVVEKEALLKKTPRTHRSVWAALNKHCGVTAYRLIQLSDFERARKYLDQWIGRLNSMAAAPVRDGDEWRKRRYAYIKINAKTVNEQEALDQYMQRHFKASSLTELDNNELEQAYRYVAGRKSRSRGS